MANEKPVRVKSGGSKRVCKSAPIEKDITGGSVKCAVSCPQKRGEELLQPYRVFISYSHADSQIAERLKEHLKDQGLFPTTDSAIRVGEAFSEEIREFIECVHVFMPLVTPSANKRLWVQQEIGYAAALHVPVCPIAMGSLPAGMNERVQSIAISKEEWVNPKDLESIFSSRLTYETVDDLVQRARSRPKHGRYDCALSWTERQELLAALTTDARKKGCKLAKEGRGDQRINRDIWRLRQRGRFSSFSIPDANLTSPVWELRNKHRYRSTYERKLLRRERKAMEAYMQCFGCDLILDIDVISKGDFTDGISAIETAIRLRLVKDFITKYLDNDNLRVVMSDHASKLPANLLIVGDWFAAEAVVPKSQGVYDRTMFTRHAPTLLTMIEEFDQDFQDSLPRISKPLGEVKAEVLEQIRGCCHFVERSLSKQDRQELDAACRELGIASR